MRRTFYLLLAYALCAGPVLGVEPVKPTYDFDDMRVIVRYVSARELATLQWEHGARIDQRDIRQSSRHGFSILKRNRETGALTCQIYLSEAPREVDDDATLSLGHELLHCMLGDYHG